MLRSIQKLIGDKRKQLIFPIFLMSLDAIGSLVMYLMLYFTVIHLLNGSLTGGLVRNYTIVCLISVILRLIIYRSGYFLCFSRGAEMCSGLRLDLANHYRSLSLGYFNQNSSGYLLSTLTKDLGTFIEPVTSLFGLPWQLFIAFVASAMGKEASLGVMASLFNTGSIWAAIEQSATVDTAALSTSMLSVISRPEALAFLFAFFFNMPCLMALTATTQETHSMKWTVRIALYYVLTALIMATIAYHVGLVIF